MSNRWKPKNGEGYWICNAWGDVNGVIWYESKFDNVSYEYGNCFSTKEKAEVANEKVKALLLSLHEENKNTGLFGKTEQLPDWCKVGEWVYYPEEMGAWVYLKVSGTKTGFILAKEKEEYDPWQISISSFHEYAKPARLRPYNEKEMKSLVGRIVTSVKGDVCLCTDYDAGSGEVCIYGALFSNTELLNSVWQINDTHCGVFEHLNEDGEWVN